MTPQLQSIKDFLNQRKATLNITRIGKEAKLPTGTLQRFMNETPYCYLTPEQIVRLLPVIEILGYKNIEL